MIVAGDILKFLDKNTLYSPLVLHGFSVCAYLWSEVLVKMATEMDRYKHIMDRVEGQVWDSAADITEIPIGLPLAVFPSNAVLQSALKQYIFYHLKAFDKVATCRYVRASQMLHTNIIKAPALFYLSKVDPVGALTSNSRVKENWENIGIQVNWNVYEKSSHVGHLRAHPKEYKDVLQNFLRQIHRPNAVSQKVQAKL